MELQYDKIMACHIVSYGPLKISLLLGQKHKRGWQ